MNAARWMAMAVAVLAAGLTAMLGPGCEPRETFPAREACDTAPYLTITDGIAPEPASVPDKLPTLAAGTKVAYIAAGDGTIRAITCAEPWLADVHVPAEGQVLAMRRGGSGIELAAGATELSSATGRSGMELASEGTQIAAAEGASGLSTETHSQTGETVQGHSGEQTEVAVREAPAAAEAQSELDLAERAAVAEVNRRVAWFGALDDEDFITRLEESNIISGFYDGEDNLLLSDEALVIAIEEREQIIRLIRTHGELAKIVFRDVSQKHRTAANIPAGAKYEGQLKVTTRTTPIQYAHPFVLVLSLTNTGKTPLLDTVILNGLPANCQFVRFGVDPKRTAGFFPYYHESETDKLIFVKLYRPIQPGETFKVAVLCQADPWPTQSEQ